MVLNESVFGPMRTIGPSYTSVRRLKVGRSGRYLLRTIFLVIFELDMMPIALKSLVNSHPICEPGERRSGKFGERM